MIGLSLTWSAALLKDGAQYCIPNSDHVTMHVFVIIFLPTSTYLFTDALKPHRQLANCGHRMCISLAGLIGLNRVGIIPAKFRFVENVG